MGLVCMVGCASSRPSVSEVRRLGQRADTEGLLNAWQNADRDSVRIAVLNGLAQNPEDRAGRALVVDQARGARSGPVRLAALRALDVHAGPDVVQVMVGGLAHPWPEVRDLCQSLLFKRGAAVDEDVLHTAVRHRLPAARASAVRLLSQSARARPEIKERVVPVLINRSTKDGDASVRTLAVEALGALNVESARDTLAELFRTDPDPRVRLAAGVAVKTITTESKEPPTVVMVLPLKNHVSRESGLADFGHQVAEYLQARLTTAQVCEVVDRSKVEVALAELRKMGRALYDGDSPNAPELGAFKLANQMVFGSIQRQGSKYTLVVNRRDVSTLRLVPGASATVTGYRADLDRMVAELAERFISRF